MFEASQPFQSAQDAIAFALAGNARLTLVSKASGNRFTFKVRACDDNPALWFVSVLTGENNESDYSYLGTIRDGTSGQRFMHGRKSRIAMSAPSAMAFDYFARAVIGRGHIPPALEIWHEGRCGRCARPLTVPSSIRSGFGPECIGKVGL